ncbi:hypothetical protein EV662_1255 [Rhodovulum marinum]|uniref:Uncharacterized protein n=2 Tax=Rhodovulum marinum TaxID=320662 RepID=A0A4R2PQP1_9RHOB|nr:hypothetical protein EV662_1255 [Rhodovulum marinum]
MPIVPPEFHAPTYTPEDVARLCRIGGLSPADPARFRQDLEDCAAIYRWESARHHRTARRADLERELAKSAKLARNLAAALDTLPPKARDALVTEIETGIPGALTGSETPFEISLDGLETEALSVALDLPAIERIIGGLASALEDAPERLGNGKRGAQRDWGLRLWMRNIHDLWCSVTDQPFTRDVTDDGQAITPASQFCVAAFEQINPDCPASRVIREQKASISTSRKIAGRIIANSDS